MSIEVFTTFDILSHSFSIIVVHKVLCLKVWTLHLYCLDILPKHNLFYLVVKDSAEFVDLALGFSTLFLNDLKIFIFYISSFYNLAYHFVNLDHIVNLDSLVKFAR